MIFKPGKTKNSLAAITERYIFILTETPNGKYNACAIGRGYYIGFYKDISQNASYLDAVKACERFEGL